MARFCNATLAVLRVRKRGSHRANMTTEEICFRFPISCCIFKRRRLKFEWCVKRRLI